MGQIYTDKNITSSQPWQSENSPGELSAHEELTNSTPALPKVPNQGRGGVLGHAWCINDTCVALGSPSYPVLPSHGSPAGGCFPGCCAPHWGWGSAKLIMREWVTLKRIWADLHALGSNEVPSSLVKLPVNSRAPEWKKLAYPHRGGITFSLNWSNIPIAWPESVSHSEISSIPAHTAHVRLAEL